MISTNNVCHRKDRPKDIAAAIRDILAVIAEKQPFAKRRAAKVRPTLEPLDWTSRFQPTRWSDGAATFDYVW